MIEVIAIVGVFVLACISDELTKIRRHLTGEKPEPPREIIKP